MARFTDVGDPTGGGSIGAVADAAGGGGDSAFSQLQTLVDGKGRSAKIVLMGVDPSTGLARDELPPRELQFWPETFTDSITMNYSYKSLPGTTSSLTQWSNNSGRSFTFEVPLVRLMVPPKVQYDEYRQGILFANPNADENLDMNCNIDYMLKYLRAFCYPTAPLGDVASAKQWDKYRIVRPPPICLMNVPGLHLSEDGSDTVWTVMTSCDIVYNKMFQRVGDWPNPKTGGAIRLCTGSLSFKQIVERPGQKRPYNWVSSKTLTDTAALYHKSSGGGLIDNALSDNSTGWHYGDVKAPGDEGGIMSKARKSLLAKDE